MAVVPRRPSQTLERIFVAGAVAYVALVLAGIVARAAGVELVDPLAAGYDTTVRDGMPWRLATSGLVVSGALPVGQLVATALVMAYAIQRLGARTWALAALAGHLGSAVVMYAVMAVAIAAGSASAERAGATADYGVSCGLAGAVGALAADLALRDGMPRRAAVLVVAAGALVWVPVALSWYGVEHPIAALAGAGVRLLMAPRR